MFWTKWPEAGIKYCGFPDLFYKILDNIWHARITCDWLEGITQLKLDWFFFFFLRILGNTGLEPFHQMGDWANNSFSGNLLEKNFQLAAGPSAVSFALCAPPKPPPPSLHSNMLFRLYTDVDAAKFISKFLLNFHFHSTTGPQQLVWRNESRADAAVRRPSRY